MNDKFIIGAIIFFAIPVLIYMCVKMGVLGYFGAKDYIKRQKEHFRKEQK